MTLNSVVLPAPFGPMSATICPVRTVMRHLVDGAQPAEVHRDALDLEQFLALSPASRSSSAMSVPESGSATVASRLCSGT